MAEANHLRRLRKSVMDWNQWRVKNPDVKPDLADADLSEINLSGANLSRADLFGAYLYRTKLHNVNLNGATVRRAILMEANLRCADLCGADLREASFYKARLLAANLTKANLSYARLVQTKLNRATLVDCHIYGASVWDVELTETTQQNLIITPEGASPISVDDLEVAQFISLLLKNQKVRRVIDTLGKKAVLILGRFSKRRKPVLDGIRESLRQLGYVPILFDFEKPFTRDTVETISIVAHLSRFVVADLSDAKSVLQELQAIVPSIPSVPIKPLLVASQEEPGMIDHLKQFRSFMPIYRYENTVQLLASLKSSVVEPAEQLATKLTGRQFDDA